MEIKKSIWQQVDAVCADHSIFATNTSALPISELAGCLKDASRMLGLHFFNPAERMQLLEIISAEATSDAALATGVAFARKIKKIPVVVNDGPGFYVSRQLNALMGECNYMLEEGIAMPVIDQALMGSGCPWAPSFSMT
jgi:3-hydroxyacyl-CoA dehydrogenase